MIKNTALLVAVSILCLAGAELLLNILQPVGAEAVPGFVTDEQTGWARPANQHGFVIQRLPGIFKTHFQTNSRGMRDREHRLEKTMPRTLALGDSMTEGWGVEENQAYPKVLEAQLHEAEIWNLGVVGYSTDQELQQLRRIVDVYHPDIVTLAFCFNDLAENSLRRALWSPNYVKPHFDIKNDQLVLTNARELHEQKLQTDRNAVRFTVVARRLVYESALYRLAKYGYQSLWQQQKVKQVPKSKPDHVWYSMDNLYRTAQPQELNKIWTLTERLLAELNQVATSHGAQFVLTYAPIPMDGTPGGMQKQLSLMGIDEPLADFDPGMIDRRLGEIARRHGIRFVPMAGHFRSAPRPDDLFLPKEVHLAVAGHELLAHVLADYLRAEGLIPVRQDIVVTDRVHPN
jgi:GDSL-like Lipase/Acylhydrolase family